MPLDAQPGKLLRRTQSEDTVLLETTRHPPAPTQLVVLTERRKVATSGSTLVVEPWLVPLVVLCS